MFLSTITVTAFPVLLGTDSGQAICGAEASAFHLSSCQMGWSYLLAIAATAVGLFCPYMAQHTDVLLEGIDFIEEDLMTDSADMIEVFMEEPVVCPSGPKVIYASNKFPGLL